MSSDVGTRVTCAQCGATLDETPDAAYKDRKPCPNCGSLDRRIEHTLEIDSAMHAHTASNVELQLIRAWDGASLTLFGILYAILVTVAGVVVAMIGTGGSWLWWAIYAVVSLSGLALALLVVPQAVISAMRWLVERAKKAPPWPG